MVGMKIWPYKDVTTYYAFPRKQLTLSFLLLCPTHLVDFP